MKSRKTLSSWLTNKYLLIIRNEENFAEKTTVSFTYSKLIVIFFSLFIVLMLISLYLSKTLMAEWFDPRHEQFVMSKQLIDMRLQFDSLSNQVRVKDQFIQDVQRVLNGEVGDISGVEDTAGLNQVTDRDLSGPLAEIDSQFRKQYEAEVDLLPASSSYLSEINQIYFFTPIQGIVTATYDPKIQHYGIDVVSKSNEPVKNVADGTVLFASWTQDAGNVIMIQHSDNMVSVYKHNSALFKKVGNFVEAGEVISLIGNTGELSTGPHLHFELWYKGNPVDPAEFISF